MKWWERIVAAFFGGLLGAAVSGSIFYFYLDGINPAPVILIAAAGAALSAIWGAPILNGLWNLLKQVD